MMSILSLGLAQTPDGDKGRRWRSATPLRPQRPLLRSRLGLWRQQSYGMRGVAGCFSCMLLGAGTGRKNWFVE
ncbi:unnamed protein product [Chrysoparadoxa australica]